LSRNRKVVGLAVIPKQRQTKATFSSQGSVTGSAVTALSGKHRLHMSLELPTLRLSSSCDRNGHPPKLSPFTRDYQFCFTIGHRKNSIIGQSSDCRVGNLEFQTVANLCADSWRANGWRFICGTYGERGSLDHKTPTGLWTTELHLSWEDVNAVGIAGHNMGWKIQPQW
jgi:hypothetical protein